MTLDANSLSTNLIVTAFVAVLVILLPWADLRICRKLGLNLRGGVSTNPNADKLLRVRQWILTAGLAVYLFVFAWLTFLSRSASDSFLVHVAPLEDLKNAFRTDHGFSDLFSRLFTEGLSVFANVKLERPEDIAQFYMNMMVFVPLGYLLPYTFRWFRERVWTRPVGVCFLISFFTENMQLMSQRGLYDLDDMISNTLGGLAGEMLYVCFAYVLTHPDWRAELRATRSWRKKSKKRSALYPCRRRIGSNCTVLYGTDRQMLWDFYVRKLGYRPVRRNGDSSGEENYLMLALGQSRIEIRCEGTRELPPQTLCISAAGLHRIRKQLLEKGIDPGPYEKDPYTGRRELRFTGPDDVQIIMTEAE